MVKKAQDKQKQPKDKTKGGRPSKYTDALGKAICRAIATSTDGLAEICAQHPEFPVKSTIYEWRYDHPQFSDWYAIARAQQADLMVELMDEIARDGRNDWMEANAKNNPGWILNGEYVGRSRLRIDTIKWKACKMLPKLYGDKPAEESKPFSDEEKDELRNLMSQFMTKHEREY